MLDVHGVSARRRRRSTRISRLITVLWRRIAGNSWKMAAMELPCSAQRGSELPFDERAHASAGNDCRRWRAAAR